MEAIAKVLCYDGRHRLFRSDNQNEVLHRTARKYTYSIWAEPEGREFVTMLFTGNEKEALDFIPENCSAARLLTDALLDEVVDE